MERKLNIFLSILLILSCLDLPIFSAAKTINKEKNSNSTAFLEISPYKDYILDKASELKVIVSLIYPRLILLIR